MAACQVYEDLYKDCRELLHMQPDDESASSMANEMSMALPRLMAAVLVFAIKSRSYFSSDRLLSIPGESASLK